MNTKQHFGLLLLAAASISSVSTLAAVKEVKIPTSPKTSTPPTKTVAKVVKIPTTPTTPTTPPILPTGIAPSLIIDKPAGGTTYGLFFINNKKIVSLASQELAALTSQVNAYGILPCLVSTDINGTPINCGAGLVSFGQNQLYSYITPINLSKLNVNFNKGVKQVFAANFLSPNGLIPGDSVGRNVHVHFNQPVTQFAMNIDSGDGLSPSIDSIQFVMGAIGGQVSLTHPLTPGIGQWVGVQAPNGIQDLDVIGLDGNGNPSTSSRAYTFDQFTVVTK